MQGETLELGVFIKDKNKYCVHINVVYITRQFHKRHAF